MPAKIQISLSEEQQSFLQVYIHRGQTKARLFKRAYILLKAAEGWTDTEMCDAFQVCPETVRQVRKRFVAGGVEAVLQNKVQERRRHALSGAQVAHLIAIACTPAPEGHEHWTLRLLADKIVALGYVPSISPETIRQVFRKNDLKPWQHEQWCIPEVSPEFVAAMEDVLDLYTEVLERPDSRFPLVCLDEKPVVLHAEARPGLPPMPGRVERRDYEYTRQGTANLFVLVAPTLGWRHVAVTEHRTRRDYAEQLRYLADEAFPAAECLRLVQDNLNTHTLAALYEAFPAEEAHRLAQRFEVHPTPKHGSWLNMAEIEISIIQRGCLSRPVATLATLSQRVAALEAERNAAACSIHWQFTLIDARTKLAHLYPMPTT